MPRKTSRLQLPHLQGLKLNHFRKALFLFVANFVKISDESQNYNKIKERLDTLAFRQISSFDSCG